MKRLRNIAEFLSCFIQLKKQNLLVRTIIRTYLLVAILAPILANEKPLFISNQGSWSFPVFSHDPYFKISENGSEKLIRKASIDWKKFPAEVKIFAPIPYGPSESDLNNYNYVSPFESQWQSAADSSSLKEPLEWRYRHWLGTTKTGADVLSGLIYSTRLSLLVGILCMLIASLIGISFGALAGYFGDEGLRLKKFSLLLSVLFFVPAWYFIFEFPTRTIEYSFQNNSENSATFIFLKVLLFLFILFLPFLLAKKKTQMTRLKSGIRIPIDTIVSRFIELFVSVPRLILIITLAALSRPSLLSLILILGFTSWTGIARMVRAEFLRLKNSAYFEATEAMGFQHYRKIFFHLLPNAFIPIRVGIIFGIAGAILAEAGLSFLGIGLAPGTVSWGSMLAAGKEQFNAWWLVLFPGLAISILLLVLNKMADRKISVGQEKLV